MKTKRTSGKKAAERVTRASGNDFPDVGFRPGDPPDLRIKAEMTREINARIKALGLTQTQAAAQLGISQSGVSKLMDGRFSGFSTDRLIALLNAMGVDVDIVLRARKQTGRPRPGVVRVRKASAIT